MRYNGARNKFKIGDEVYVPKWDEYGTVNQDIYAPDIYRVQFDEGDTHWFKQKELQSVDESLNPE